MAADTTALRSLDWDRSRFDIEFGLRNGTTYNSFLIRGERTALVDTSHAKFLDRWMPALTEIIDPRAIDILIVSHTEPDHSGLIGDLLGIHPDIEIVGSRVAIHYLRDQLHRPFRSREVKSGDSLDLGVSADTGLRHTIEFISAPNLHWPDTIFSYDHGSGTLFTCDAFGLQHCSENLFDTDPGAIAPDFRFYYDCLMGPNARSVLQALKRIAGLAEITTVATGHGPLLRHHIGHWLNDYRQWSSERNRGNDDAAVCYVSQYGFCDRISQALARGIGKSGAQVQLVDLRSTDPQELASLRPGQWAGCYDSFGRDAEHLFAIAGRLRTLGVKQGFAPLELPRVPDAADVQRCEEAGTDLGLLLTKEKTLAAMKALDGGLDQALGRLSGGLFVVTARQRERALITVAVAKARAIESLLQVGDRFVLNVLRQDNHQRVLRHFLRRFPPGADRFAEVAILDGIARGGPVLSEALAFLGCRVSQRLETADHWILIAAVEEGNVSDTEAATAVHHRKSGTHY